MVEPCVSSEICIESATSETAILQGNSRGKLTFSPFVELARRQQEKVPVLDGVFEAKTTDHA
jgi:hypothetical protein